MKQYRKKPVTIEAVQFNGYNHTEIKDFVGEQCEVEIYDNEITHPVAHIVIHTLEGDMEVSNGDYVIKGVKGEFYPCKPDIFEQTYESAEIKQEVDLEKEIKDWCVENITGVRPIYTADSLIYGLLPKTAKHFYELGLKAGKERPSDDVNRNLERIILNKYPGARKEE